MLCEVSHMKTPLSKVPTHSTSAHQATNNNILLCNSRHHMVTRLLKLISYDVTLMKINQQISWVLSSVSLVVEFKRWWVLKRKIFGQESTYSREIIFKKSVAKLWFIKMCQNCTFKVNFQCQKSTDFSQKKLRLRPNILAKRLGGRSLSRLMKNFGLGLLTD